MYVLTSTGTVKGHKVLCKFHRSMVAGHQPRKLSLVCSLNLLSLVVATEDLFYIQRTLDVFLGGHVIFYWKIYHKLLVYLQEKQGVIP